MHIFLNILLAPKIIRVCLINFEILLNMFVFKFFLVGRFRLYLVKFYLTHLRLILSKRSSLRSYLLFAHIHFSFRRFTTSRRATEWKFLIRHRFNPFVYRLDSNKTVWRTCQQQRFYHFFFFLKNYL